MRTFIALLFALFAVGIVSAQVEVASFRLLENDLTANTHATMVKDMNGEVTALIKVVTPEQGFVFDGGIVGIVKTVQEVGEIWVYVPYGIKRITIRHPKFGVLRDYYLPMAVDKARTYELVLKTPKTESVVGVNNDSVPASNLSDVNDSITIDQSVKPSVEDMLSALGYGMYINRRKLARQNSQQKYVPNWYVMGQFGIQDCLVEVDHSTSTLYSDNAQLGVGYNFNKIWGARLTVNGWESMGGWDIGSDALLWTWNYISPVVDVTANLSNWLMGYKSDRLVNFGVFAGLGANVAFGNDEAAVANEQIKDEFGLANREGLRELWEGTKAFFTGRVGANVDLRISDDWSAGLEIQANFVDDSYNSKLGGATDCYFNVLMGVKYRFKTKK